MGIDIQNLFSFCKYFKAIKYIIEESDNLNVEEDKKNLIKHSFNDFVSIRELNNLWTTCIDILSIVNDLYPTNFNFIKHIVKTI